MGSLWGLALPLLFCCLEAGAPGSPAGLSTHRPGPLVTANHTEVTAVTQGVNTSSRGASQTADLAEISVPSDSPLETQALGLQTFDKTLISARAISEAETRETETVLPTTETKALTKGTPSKFMGMITNPVEMSATRDRPSGVGMTAVETVTGSDFSEAVFDTFCTDDSSEEATRITMDPVALAHTAPQARTPASESSSVPAISTSPALAPEIMVPPKVVAYKITKIKIIDCSITKIDTVHSPTGGKTLSTPETSALPDFTGAKSHLTRTMTSSGTSSTASILELVTSDTTIETPHTTSGTPERETIAVRANTRSGTSGTASVNALDKTSAPSGETASYSEVSGAVTISTEAGSTVGKATSSAGSSATVPSLSAEATPEKSTRSDISATHSAASGPVLISGSSLPSVYLTTANGSQETTTTLAKTTASAETANTASTAGRKSPTATPTAAWTGWTTEATTAGGGGGFLLLRLRAASPEDLTDPRVAQRLMQQLRQQLDTHMLAVQVSLLHARRD